MLAGDMNRKTPNEIYVYECHRNPDLSDSVVRAKRIIAACRSSSPSTLQAGDSFNFDDPCLGGYGNGSHERKQELTSAI